MLTIDLLEKVPNDSTISLVWRDDLDFNINAEEFKVSLDPFVINEKKISKWPGTEIEGLATIRYYRLTVDSAEIIKNISTTFGFLSPDYPEDLAIYYGDKIIYGSSSHEKLEWLDIEH